jgi:hypothetical protein
MNCNRRCGSGERRKEVNIILKREELLYDIRNCAYVEGDVMKEEPDGHQRHQVQDIGEDGNIDRVTRMMDLAHAECVEALFPYTKHEVADGTMQCDALTETTWYEVHMLLPDEYSQTTVSLLRHYIHEYIVDRVLEDWLSITDPRASANWKGKAEEMMELMKSAVNLRTGRVRRTMTPF